MRKIRLFLQTGWAELEQTACLEKLSPPFMEDSAPLRRRSGAVAECHPRPMMRRAGCPAIITKIRSGSPGYRSHEDCPGEHPNETKEIGDKLRRVELLCHRKIIEIIEDFPNTIQSKPANFRIVSGLGGPDREGIGR